MKQQHIKQGRLRQEEEKAWTKILKNWIQVHKIYFQQSGNDKAYSYNERASISMLAAAIWKSKGIAIEEYVAEKNHNGETKKGRVDLWFKIEEFTAVVEAKQIRKSVKGFTLDGLDYDKQLKTTNKFMQYAEEDVKKSIGEEPNGYAILFLDFYNRHNIEINLKNILGQIEKSDCDFYACVSCGEGTDQSPAGIILGKKYLRKSIKKK